MAVNATSRDDCRLYTRLKRKKPQKTSSKPKAKAKEGKK